MKKATLSIMLVMAVSLFAGAQEVRAEGYSDPWGAQPAQGECIVRTGRSSGGRSLKSALQKYNDTSVNDQWRLCKNKISFDIENSNIVNVSGTLNLTQPYGSGLVIDGKNVNTGSSVELKTSFANGPVFKVQSSGGSGGTVTIQNFSLIRGETDNANTFLECLDSTRVVLNEIKIANKPARALTFRGCDHVTINGVEITNGIQMQGGDQEVVSIYDAENVTVNLEATGSNNFGTLLSVNNVTTETSIDVSGNNISEGFVAKLFNINGLTKLKVIGSSVQNGIVLDDVDGANLGGGVAEVNLLGRRQPTASPNGEGDTTGVGVKLNVGATNIKFNSLTQVRLFGADGIQILDSSDNNTFDGVFVEKNGGNGIFVSDEAFSTDVVNSKIVNNVVCGIVLNTKQGTTLKNNQLQQNGSEGCPVKIGDNSTVQELEKSDVILIPTQDSSMVLDVVPTLVGGGGNSAQILELHRLTRGAFNTTGPVATGKIKKKPLKADTTARSVVSGELPGTDSSPSYIDEFNLSELPDPVDRQVSDHYFAILTTQGGQVVAYWQGKALGSGTLNISCYEDPTSGQKYRVYEQSLDSDSDGLKDHEEDKNMNCEVDPGETSPDTADTDGDGLDDRIEALVSATDPQIPDSDNDGLLDGQEDLNADGSFQAESGETDPMKADTDGDEVSDSRERALGTDPNTKDTDGDGLSDGTDECPNLHKDQGICYYAFCAEGLTLPSDQDSDEDGIRDDDEDKNHNCQRDLDETDANNDDTDGDGIPDGIEDYNQNGKYEPELGESNPLNTDTDGDGIGDGAEDKNHDGKIESGAGETSPILTDSDGDTLLDNVEDKNKNGAQDPGETSAALADTDGDGMNDNVDPAPWSINPNAVVYYCDVDLDQDTDGDGLNDKEEDANGDCLHTPTGKEPHPLKADTDADGLDDGLEECYQTNPNVADTDGDGRSDFDEVKASGLTCTNMYNLGSTNPLRAEYGSCSLNTGDATSGSVLPIILMMALAVIPMVVIRRKKEM